MLLKPIIPIERASEETITMLIDMGVLLVGEDGLHANENYGKQEGYLA